MIHPDEQIQKNQAKIISESPPEYKEFHATIFRVGNAAYIYHQLAYSSAYDAVEKITSSGRLYEVYERCAYYDDRVATGLQSKIHAYNALLKMLREEFKIEKPKRKSMKEVYAKEKKEKKQTQIAKMVAEQLGIKK